MSAWDKGKAAARRGESKSSNPYDVLGSRYSQSKHEQLASEWMEGWLGYRAENEAELRSLAAKRGAATRRFNAYNKKILPDHGVSHA